MSKLSQRAREVMAPSPTARRVLHGMRAVRSCAGRALGRAGGAAGATAQDYWDQADLDAVRDVSWLAIEEISLGAARAFHPSGDPRQVVDELLVPIARRRPDGLRGLALVCGDMAAERGFFLPRGELRFASVVGVDLSPESLARAASFTSEFPFEPRVADANELRLEPGSLDLAVGMHGIHHIRELAPAFDELARALTPDGVLFMYEWIGPEFLQIPARNALVARLLLLTFPRRERRTHQGRHKGLFLQLPPSAFDPSEACASSLLEPEFMARFDVVRAVHFGALSYPMFEGNAPNIDMTDPTTARRVHRVLRIERWLTDRRVVQPLFLMAVGRPKACAR